MYASVSGAFMDDAATWLLGWKRMSRIKGGIVNVIRISNHQHFHLKSFRDFYFDLSKHVEEGI